jgi:serine/threonine protein kinase
MEHSQHRRRPSSPPAPPYPHPHYSSIPHSASLALKTNQSTPASSPGLFSPTALRHNNLPPTSLSESNSPAPELGTPYLHPLQSHKVRETHKALIEEDLATGRKLINQYEVIEEIGRGMHGKVKLARNVETGENVAIKIIPRFSKKRRLGKVTAKSPQDKTMKEIAILKKIRHPNVVALLEVIDDPELKKIYMVLEHAELGEIVWRKKGLPHICYYERRRTEREMHGEPPTADEERYDQILEQRQRLKEMKRARMAQNYIGATDYWSVEHGAADDPGSSYGQQSRIASKEDFAISESPSSRPGSRSASRGPSRSQSIASVGLPPPELSEEVDWEEDLETPGPLRSNPNSATALDGTMYGAYLEDGSLGLRGRSPSMADSIISHMSSIDFVPQMHRDSFADDFSYVPCFTLDQARSTFRDTLLGLEYLHYQGVVHRDIKPANLLWSKGHRVKISDFGVSYFGRPIREGEPDEPVSESEAMDFDDDVELSKTVGTPAFFAPEICYSEEGKEPPRVSEQIDVWSLGVTLYCLIFARIPFLAEDEFQMFRKIATEDVHIPRKRLRPVDPSTSPTTTSLYKRHNNYPYRNDNDLAYEEVDGLLYDLLRQMLTKNPDHRIKLRDIKRHPWVIQGVTNPIGWLDDTDPARPSSGRKIEVNDRDVSDAVVPLTFLERARSVVRKAVGKVIHPLTERSESHSRRRATSSVASSAGDSMANGPPSNYPSNDRRRSMLPDDYFASVFRDGVPREIPPYDPLATVLPAPEVAREIGGDHVRHVQGRTLPQAIPSGSAPGSLRQTLRHARSLSKPSDSVLERRARPIGSQTTPTTPMQDGQLNGRTDYVDDDRRIPRNMETTADDSSRSQSVDRGLFEFTDKHSPARVGVSQAVAPGDILRPITPAHPRPLRTVDVSRSSKRNSIASPPSSALQHDITPSQEDYVSMGQPMPPRTLSRSPRPRKHTASNPESLANTQAAVVREMEMDLQQSTGTIRHLEPASTPSSPSPDNGLWSHPGGPTRGDTMTTVKSSSMESMDGIGTPLTSPSEVTSPISPHPPAKIAAARASTFQSDPSLPALLSGASSVSADMEAELLARPGIVSNRPSLLETTDSLTPPADAKEPSDGFPLGQVFGNPPAMESGPLTLHLEPPPPENSEERFTRRRSSSNDADDDDDGSDDGILLMAKPKRKSIATASPARPGPFEARRRDTNISTTSVETAKPYDQSVDVSDADIPTEPSTH